MIPGAPWRRRPVPVPPWFSAILLVGGILFALAVLPVLASAITPGAGDASGTSPASAAHAKASKGAASKDVKDARRPDHRAGRPADSRAGTSTEVAGTTNQQVIDDTDPLPRSGAGSTARLVTAGALLFGGLAMLSMIGFSGARPWPGRYVRRI